MQPGISQHFCFLCRNCLCIAVGCLMSATKTLCSDGCEQARAWGTGGFIYCKKKCHYSVQRRWNSCFFGISETKRRIRSIWKTLYVAGNGGIHKDWLRKQMAAICHIHDYENYLNDNAADCLYFAFVIPTCAFFYRNGKSTNVKLFLKAGYVQCVQSFSLHCLQSQCVLPRWWYYFLRLWVCFTFHT